MSKPIYLADLDGSLADFDGKMLEDFLKICSPAEKESYYENGESLRTLENKYPHIKERTRLIKRQPNWWKDLKPISMGMTLLKLAHELGYECHILTQGPCKIPAAWSEKLLWVQENIPYEIHKNRVHVVSDKSIAMGHILYDDYPDYCINWLSNNPQGKVIMPVAPDNKDFIHDRVFKLTSGPRSNFASAGALLHKHLEVTNG